MHEDETGHRADEIVAENIGAVGAIYMAWQLEELRVFDVVDRLVERFTQGMLVIRDDSGAEALEQYRRDRDERLPRQERFALYSRALGAPGADGAHAAPNRDFDELWRRFLSAVADYDHQQRTAPRPDPRSLSITRDHVRTAGRRLAANATTAVSSVTGLAVRRLIDQTQQALEILKAREILSAYGVQSPWGVIDRVAASELAAAVPNITRHRTMADAGRAILDLVAANPDWSSTQDTERVKTPDIHPDLVRQAERWLKAAGS